MISTVCIIGAGTMGSGIAQVAAQGGYQTLLFDINDAMLEKAKSSIETSLQMLVNKQKITREQSSQIISCIHFVSEISRCIADLFIEAIIEKPEAKIDVFNQLAAINSTQAIFASNTSSLSISLIQQEVANPERVAGMHFFNPAQLMKLVEVVEGNQTNLATIDHILTVCTAMNKMPVLCKDAPGFIVNRVARHYYLEAMKLVELGIASIEDVDAVMEASGFKMGPFKLMDLIGMDINLAVSQSLYEAFNKEERFRPSGLQIDKVEKGMLGKKTGSGFYQYA